MSTVKNNIIANYLGQVWSGVMAISFLPVYIEYLGIEAYGLIGVFVVMHTLLLLLDIGMTPTLNREMARFSAGEHSPQSIRNLLRSLEIICFSVATLIAISIWACSGYLANEWLNVEGLSIDVVVQALSLMAVVVALRFCEGIYRGALYGLERQVWYNVAYAILTTLRYAGAVVILISVSNSIEAFFVWQGIVSLISVVVFAFSVHKSLPQAALKASFSRESIAGIWKFATGMLGITALTAFLLHADKILLSSMLPLREFGYYSLAATAATVLFMIVVPVTQAIFPRMVKLSSRDDKNQLPDLYHMTTQLVTVLTAPAAMVLFFFADGVIYMWSGNIDLSQNSAPLLSILILGCFLNGLAHIPYQLQLAYGWTSLLVKTNALIVVGLVAGIYLLTPIYGAIGAAWIWLIMNAVYLIISSHFMHRKLIQCEKWKWYFSDILLPSIGGVCVVLLVSEFYSRQSFDRLDWFALLSLTWVISTLAAILLTTSLKEKLISGALNYAHSKI